MLDEDNNELKKDIMDIRAKLEIVTAQLKEKDKSIGKL